MKLISAAAYYLQSVPTLLRGVDIMSAWPALWHRRAIVRLRNGMKLVIEEPMDLWVVKEVILDRCYESQYAIKKGDVVIDVGASLGDFAIFVSRRARHVYSYDMEKSETDLMKENVRLNHTKNVSVFTQQVTSLEMIFRTQGLKRCDFLKIDCEGAEYLILAATADTTLYQVRHIAMEVHWFTQAMRRDYMTLIKRFMKLGYHIIEVNNPVHDTIGFVYASLEDDL